ncbi:hypothetical protein [Cognatilysobacter xinjiangensis]|nr:hypothetical protein [Lysobacter xinjiangensis]
MDISSPLKPDVFRVVVVILLPGMLAAFPWAAWFIWPALLQVTTWQDAGVIVGASVLALSLVVGMIIEDVGSEIEVKYVDRYVCRTKSLAYSDFDQQWMSYLFTTSAERFVAQRYVRAMVTRLKFELSMIPACTSAAFAIALAWVKDVGFDWQTTLGLVIATAAIAIYMLDQARKGAWQLHEIRMEICRRELGIPLSSGGEKLTSTLPLTDRAHGD